MAWRDNLAEAGGKLGKRLLGGGANGGIGRILSTGTLGAAVGGGMGAIGSIGDGGEGFGRRVIKGAASGAFIGAAGGAAMNAFSKQGVKAASKKTIQGRIANGGPVRQITSNSSAGSGAFSNPIIDMGRTRSVKRVNNLKKQQPSLIGTHKQGKPEQALFNNSINASTAENVVKTGRVKNKPLTKLERAKLKTGI